MTDQGDLKQPDAERWEVAPSTKWKRCGPVYQCRACGLRYCAHMTEGHERPGECAGVKAPKNPHYRADISLATRKSIAKRYAAGVETMQEIADDHGVSPGFVRKCWERSMRAKRDA